MSFFSLTPQLSVSPIVFPFSSTLSSIHLPDLVCRSFLICFCLSDVYLPVCLPVCVFGFFFFFLDRLNLLTQLACTQTHLYELLSLSYHPRSPFLSLSSCLVCSHTPTCTPHTHTRHRQMAHLPDKLPIHALTAPMSTLLPWVVRPRTRPPTPPTPLSPLPPITSRRHAATFPAPWLCSTPTNPPTPPSSLPKWEWPPSPPHLPPQGYTFNRG